MENASKALIIAGAILLSILIIGLGMTIFNQAKDAMGNTGLDSTKIKAYNDEFTPYVGTSVKGSDVRQLIDDVKNHNLAQENPDDATDEYIIQVNGKHAATDLDTEKNATKPGKKYKVEITEYKNGLIKQITTTVIP